MDPSTNMPANRDAVTRLRDGRSRNRGVIPGGGITVFLFSKATQLSLVSSQPPIHWIMIISYEGLKRPGAWTWPLISTFVPV